MRRWILGSIVGALAAAVAVPAAAEQYNVVANAGNDGDAHVDNDDPNAFAEFFRAEGGGEESYNASADAGSGSVSAYAAHSDPLPPLTITTGAAAGIAETIHFDELPATSVTIRGVLAVETSASRNVGFANASATLTIGACSTSSSYNAVSGATSGSNCPGAGPGSIEFVLTRDQIIAANGELDIEVQVSAQLEAQGGLDATASASGALPLLLARGAGPPPPGRAYLSLDPPLQISYTGGATSFPAIPVPEPGAPLLAAVGSATLAAFRRRRA
jgi:hypothetical protein